MREFIDEDVGSEYEEKKDKVLPIINITIDNKNYKALVDTGAELSLINDNIVTENHQFFVNKIINISKINLKNANGKKLAELNRLVNVDINILDFIVNCEFLIMPKLQFDVILGADILGEAEAFLNFKSKCLEIGKKVVKFIGFCGNVINEIHNAEIDAETQSIKSNQVINFECPPDYKNQVLVSLKAHKNLINFESRIARDYVHNLQVDETKEFRCKPYPLPFKYRDKVDKEIFNMLRDNIIESARTNFINPLVIVNKKTVILDCV